MLPGFFKVWYNPDSMINILAFTDVTRKFRITMDTTDEYSINVHFHQGSDHKVLKFKEMECGLFILDRVRQVDCKEKITFLNLDNDNKLYYTKREIASADAARNLSCNIPGYNKFQTLVDKGYFRNSPVTGQDVHRAIAIYGMETSALQGQGTRRRPQPMATMPHIPLPKTIRDLHSTITVSVNYVFLQGIPMLHSISGTTFMFRTLEPVFENKQNKADILKGARNVINTYQSRVITVEEVNAYIEFDYTVCPMVAFVSISHVSNSRGSPVNSERVFTWILGV